MKKPRTVFWAAALILLSCVPHAATAQDCAGGVINVTLKGDRLVFASIAEYRRAVDQPSEETRQQLARTIATLTGFTSFAQASPDRDASLIQDEYFASILNAQLVVQIGDHIFRVNPAKESVYALSTANENEYSDLLAENVLNPHIRTFSVDDDVLDEIQEGGQAVRKQTQPLLLCKETGIGNQSAVRSLDGHEARAVFNRFGIYFTLFGSVPNVTSHYVLEFVGGIGDNLGHIFYRKRCGKAVSNSLAIIPSILFGVQRYTAYSGTTNLNQVYFFFRLNPYLIPGAKPTGFVGFRVNK
jgi:hypothetical protein